MSAFGGGADKGSTLFDFPQGSSLGIGKHGMSKKAEPVT
jgi:hypothetical protein